MGLYFLISTIVFSTVSIVLSTVVLRRTLRLRREMDARPLPAPETPPEPLEVETQRIRQAAARAAASATARTAARDAQLEQVRQGTVSLSALPATFDRFEDVFRSMNESMRAMDHSMDESMRALDRSVRASSPTHLGALFSGDPEQWTRALATMQTTTRAPQPVVAPPAPTPAARTETPPTAAPRTAWDRLGDE